MTEPASNTVAAVAIATGAITLSGSIIGMQYDALLVGLFGGLISLMHLPPMGAWKMAGTLFSAVIMAGLISPFGVEAAHAYLDWTAKVPNNVVRLASALVIGIIAQAAIPLLLRLLAKASGSPAGTDGSRS